MDESVRLGFFQLESEPSLSDKTVEVHIARNSGAHEVLHFTELEFADWQDVNRVGTTEGRDGTIYGCLPLGEPYYAVRL